MKCLSCEIELDAKMQFAINQNVCPFCGGSIMDDELKELLITLHDVMEDLSMAYQDQLDDWMLSNHNYIKTDSPQISQYLPKGHARNKDDDFEDRKNKKFTVKVDTGHGEQEIQAEKIQSEDKTNEFFKRAEAVKPNIEGFPNAVEKTKQLKALAQQIKREGSAVQSQAWEMGTGENMDSETASALHNMIAEEEGGYHSALAGSDMNDISGDIEDKIPSHVLAMANRAKQYKDPNADLERLRQIQEKAQGRGSGGGVFSRV